LEALLEGEFVAGDASRAGPVLRPQFAGLLASIVVMWIRPAMSAGLTSFGSIPTFLFPPEVEEERRVSFPLREPFLYRLFPFNPVGHHFPLYLSRVSR